MLKYVKICPRCGHANDEFSETCAVDGEFLGMAPAVPAAATSDSVTEENVSAPAENATVETRQPETQQIGVPSRVLYLDIAANGDCHEIHDGWVIGQAHPTSQAEVQLEGIPGINFVHRRHCRFENREDGWYVIALEQPSYTNPTFINQEKVEPGQGRRLRNGDRLGLSNVIVNVRIIEF